jgi:hypothetical protein
MLSFYVSTATEYLKVIFSYYILILVHNSYLIFCSSGYCCNFVILIWCCAMLKSRFVLTTDSRELS